MEKDVLRTDRVLEFYKGQDNPHIADLYEMLMTYCQYNFDLGKSTILIRIILLLSNGYSIELFHQVQSSVAN